MFHLLFGRALKLGASAAFTLLLLLAPNAIAAAPVQWNDTAGSASATASIGINQFLTNQLWVDVGDSVKWTVGSPEFHTVTFLAGNPPPPLIVVGPNGPDFNPAAVTPSGPSSYDGSAASNSGLLTEGQTFSLTFSKAGDYPFLCLVHEGMTGVIHVASAGTPYPHTQAFYNSQATQQRAADLADGTQLMTAGLVAARLAPGENVTAGTGDNKVFVPRFLPGPLTIHAGQTVVWTNRDTNGTPHTVTFGAEPPGGPFGSFAPSGSALDGPGHATISSPTDTVNSGFLGVGLPFGTQFAITFDNPGTYNYICALHDDQGMTGTIRVVPSGAS